MPVQVSNSASIISEPLVKIKKVALKEWCPLVDMFRTDYYDVIISITNGLAVSKQYLNIHQY